MISNVMYRKGLLLSSIVLAIHMLSKGTARNVNIFLIQQNMQHYANYGFQFDVLLRSFLALSLDCSYQFFFHCWEAVEMNKMIIVTLFVLLLVIQYIWCSFGKWFVDRGVLVWMMVMNFSKNYESARLPIHFQIVFYNFKSLYSWKKHHRMNFFCCVDDYHVVFSVVLEDSFQFPYIQM